MYEGLPGFMRAYRGHGVVNGLLFLRKQCPKMMGVVVGMMPWCGMRNMRLTVRIMQRSRGQVDFPVLVVGRVLVVWDFSAAQLTFHHSPPAAECAEHGRESHGGSFPRRASGFCPNHLRGNLKTISGKH